MKKLYIIILCGILLSSCKATHNIPQNQTPNESIDSITYKVYVDQNGDFYPDNWEQKYGSHPPNAAKRNGAYSLNAIAINRNIQRDLKTSRESKLTEIKDMFKNKKKLYIFIHGYNNNEVDASNGFDTIKSKIKLNSDDGIIKFYWDGLKANGPVNSFDIWFNASGYSQLAGERALRPIINLFSSKDIVIISHSRGASVLLSSLSNPPYNNKFAEDTYKFHSIKVHNEPSLIENNNNIDILMLAPAIGQVDFRQSDYDSDTNMTPFRKFSSQVKNIYLTVNKDDKTLGKYFKPISSKYNPTDLGYNLDVFNLISKSYSQMKYFDFKGLESHNFIKYVNDPRFKLVLKEMKIPVN